MTSAILQGVPGTTLDTDLWVDLPSRGYIALQRLIAEQGGTALAKTVFALEDDSLVNFLFSVDGLKSFEAEYKKSRRVRWNGMTVRLLSLERIVASKRFIGRPKDLAQLPILEEVIWARKRGGRAG